MKKIIVFLLFISLIVQGGCTTPKNNVVENLEEDVVIEVGGADREIIKRSEDISDGVVELFGIDDSVTVLFNDIALVGIVLAYDQELTEDLRNSINARVVEIDPLVKEVKITKKDKNFKQLNQIIEGLLNGTPYDNYVTDISKLMEKIDKEK